MTYSTIPLLPLSDMDKRHYGLSPTLAECYLEAARVCLDRYYTSPQEFHLKDDQTPNKVLTESKGMVKVEWERPDARSKIAWTNDDDATRDGAYACALASVELSRGYVAVRRAEKLTGADYYVAPVGAPNEDLENFYRLEVSGTNSKDSEVRTRLKDKVDQALRGASNLPAFAAVVGFKAQLIIIQTVEQAT